jgi:hypothetical protein
MAMGTSIDFKLCLCVAIESRNNTMVKFLIGRYLANPDRMILRCSSHAARPRFLKLFPTGSTLGVKSDIEVAFAGAPEYGTPFTIPMMMAALYNNVHVAKLLLDTGIGHWDNNVAVLAALAGSHAFLTWALDNGPHLTNDTMDVAAARAIKGDSLECLKVLHTKYVNVPDDFSHGISRYAARLGRRRILEYLLDIGAWKADVIYHAVEGGHLDLFDFLLKWREEHDIPGRRMHLEPNMLYHSAASGGHVAMLDKLSRDGYIADKTIPWFCQAAIAGLHFDALRWLHHHGFAWDEWVVCGLTDSIIHVNNPRDPKIILRLRILRWMVELGCSFKRRVIASVIRVDRKLALWLLSRRHGPRKDEKIYEMLLDDPISLWHWALDHGLQPPTMVMMRRYMGEAVSDDDEDDDNELDDDHSDEDKEKYELVRQCWCMGRAEYTEAHLGAHLEIRGEDGKIIVVKGPHPHIGVCSI